MVVPRVTKVGRYGGQVLGAAVLAATIDITQPLSGFGDSFFRQNDGGTMPSISQMVTSGPETWLQPTLPQSMKSGTQIDPLELLRLLDSGSYGEMYEKKMEPIEGEYFGEVDGKFSDGNLQKAFLAWTLSTVMRPLFKHVAALKRMLEEDSGPEKKSMSFDEFYAAFDSHQERDRSPIMKQIGDLYRAAVKGDVESMCLSMVQLNRFGLLIGKSAECAVPAERRGTNAYLLFLRFFVARAFQLLKGSPEATAGDQFFFSEAELARQHSQSEDQTVYAELVIDRVLKHEDDARKAREEAEEDEDD